MIEAVQRCPKGFWGATIERSFDARGNGFGFVRCTLAAMVFVTHSIFLLGMEAGCAPLLQMFGAMGVTGFFVVSGFLVSASSHSCSDAAGFMLRRIGRIFPGFWLCLVLTAFIYAPGIVIAEGGDLVKFLRDPSGPIEFCVRNAVLRIVQHDISGIYSEFPQPGANGALWTLGWEFACYALVAAMMFAGRGSFRRWLTGLGFGAAWMNLLFPPGSFFGLYYTRGGVPEFFAAFALGMVCWEWRDRVRSLPVASCVCGIVSMIAVEHGLRSWIWLPMWSYFILCLGLSRSLSRAEFLGDYSYGIYLYHFPIMQLWIALLSGCLTPWLLGLLTLPVVFLSAWISWNWVELPGKRFFGRMARSLGSGGMQEAGSAVRSGGP